MERQCTKCGHTKPLEEFHAQPKGRFGKKAQCRVCAAIYHQDRYPVIRNRMKARARERVTGWTAERFDRKWIEQSGKCAICGRQLDKEGGQADNSACADHQHDEKRPRSILCNPCNRAISALQENPALLREAAMYLETDHGPA